MKRIAILLSLLLLTGCALVRSDATTEMTVPATSAPTISTEEPTTAPTTMPTTPPATQAPTEPPTEATEFKPLFTPELWQAEPEYLSYKTYFSQDRVYFPRAATNWMVTYQDAGYLITLSANSGLTVSCDALESSYSVPNSYEIRYNYGETTLLGTDGKYAYLASSTHIIQVELASGAVTELVSSKKIQNAYLCDGVVLYYIRYAWGEPYICRMYTPEQREDILRILEKPIDNLWLRRPESSLGDVMWTGYNPELTVLFEAELKDPNSSYQKDGSYDYSELWQTEDLLYNPAHAYLTRWIYLALQNNTGVNALYKGIYDCFLGSFSEGTGIMSDCCFGTNWPHDHYGWEITTGDLPVPLDGQWLPVSLPDVQIPAFSMIREMQHTDKAVCFITENNTIVMLSEESGSPTTVYQANYGQLRELDIEGKGKNNLYVADGDKVVQIDLENNQYRLLVEHEHISELWLWDDGRIYFALKNGMFYKQLIYDPEAKTFEETHFV